jgi:hypothetical protein
MTCNMTANPMRALLTRETPDSEWIHRGYYRLDRVWDVASLYQAIHSDEIRVETI